ncbi:MAG: peptidylprolyl isomerase [Gemmatimonadaceae bacterium]|nr:peptidylprolyl isomerase [Gemmatimonadaceae bacterium]
MWHLLLPLLAQVPVERPVLEAEHAREAGAVALVRATTSGTPRVRAMAARGLGRLENPVHRQALEPLLASPSPLVRAAAAGALAQMKVARDWAPALASERDATVRAAIYEAIGRGAPVPPNAESLLAGGLRESDLGARTGAARGLESLVRLNRRTVTPSAATLTALRAAFASTASEEFRIIALLVLNAARAQDTATAAAALADPSPQVRRLAIIGTRRFVQDPSPLVRVEAFRYATSCDTLAAGLRDTDDHVAITAGHALMERGCPSAALSAVAASGPNWRRRGNALVALARRDTAAVRRALPGTAGDTVWQARAYAAQAARAIGDSVTLDVLARDSNPNVAAAALRTADDAVRALRSDHAGLVLAGTARLAQAPDLAARLPRVVGAFNRLTGGGSMTMRDPREALLKLIGQVPDTSTNALLRDALYDRDPAIAAVAASILTARTGTAVAPGTTALPIPPIPPAHYIAGLAGAQARITMRGLGSMTLALLTSEAPVTVGVFAQLAEAGQYTGLTFHRIVPNFVVQGGSPGADEYDGRSREFMRDELGFARNARGTIGISTRGRDTGDGQLYFNLVDNVRLDRDYTVLARMVSGLDVMDRIQEGNVIERVEIIRRPR